MKVIPSLINPVPVGVKDRILPLEEVIDRVGMPRATIYNWIKKGKFPETVHVTDPTSKHLKGWRESDIDAWLKQREESRSWMKTDTHNRGDSKMGNRIKARLNPMQYHKLYNYLENRAGEEKEIDEWRKTIAEEASNALGYAVSEYHVDRASKELDIAIKRIRKQNGTQNTTQNGTEDHNIEVIVKRLNSIEEKVNSLWGLWK